MEKEKVAIRAHMGLFSGRPNPEINLAGGLANEFEKLVKPSIGKERSQPPPEPRLGEYYGFFIDIPEERAGKAGIPAKLTIYKHVITEQSGREQMHWRDLQGAEEFLVRQAYEQGHEELLKAVGFQRPEGQT
jgi:hypothetical protein